jgi:hypothetical protein
MLRNIRTYFPLQLIILFLNGVLLCQPTAQKAPSGEYTFTIKVSQKPLQIIVDEDASFDNLMQNTRYQTIATEAGGSSNIFPTIKEETFSPAKIEISGNPSDDVLVSFYMPSKIYDSSNDHCLIYMNYNDFSASVIDNITGEHRFFNPLSGTQLTLPTNGSNSVLLVGGNPIVPMNTQPGEFIGQAIISVSYLGGG